MSNAENENERAGLLCIIDDLNQRRRFLCRADRSRKKRWRRAKQRERFYQNQNESSKQLLKPRGKAELNVRKEAIDDYVKSVA